MQNDPDLDGQIHHQHKNVAKTQRDRCGCHDREPQQESGEQNQHSLSVLPAETHIQGIQHDPDIDPAALPEDRPIQCPSDIQAGDISEDVRLGDVIITVLHRTQDCHIVIVLDVPAPEPRGLQKPSLQADHRIVPKHGQVVLQKSHGIHVDDVALQGGVVVRELQGIKQHRNVVLPDDILRQEHAHEEPILLCHLPVIVLHGSHLLHQDADALRRVVPVVVHRIIQRAGDALHDDHQQQKLHQKGPCPALCSSFFPL